MDFALFGLAQGGGGGLFGGGMVMPMIILLGIMYFMMIRPQQRREKERKRMIAAIKSGERIIFSGGILGTVTNVKDHTLLVKIADKVKIEVARGAVTRVLDKGDEVAESDNKQS